MTIEQFRASLVDETAPGGLSVVLQALWHDARGDWSRAHTLVQDVETADAARVHAYLHRKDGDIDNARYWYSRAKAQEVSGSLDDEWRTLVESWLE
jgi:hypothetical protein